MGRTYVRSTEMRPRNLHVFSCVNVLVVRYGSPCLWNQLSDSFHSVILIPVFLLVTHLILHMSDHLFPVDWPLSPEICRTSWPLGTLLSGVRRKPRRYPLKNTFLAWIWTSSNVYFLGPPTSTHIPNDISIGSANFAGLMIITDWQTDRQTDQPADHATPSVAIGRI